MESYTSLIPLISAQVGTVAGLLFITVFIFYTGQFSYLNVKKSSLIYFTLTGILSSVGWITMMKSLETGSVSAITTIVYSYPLFAIFFSRLFVRDERIIARTIIGSILIVMGVAVVTIF